MQTIYAQKTLAAASSAGVAVISTTALSSAVVLNTSSFDTQRRLTAWSTLGDISGVTFTITGLNQNGGIISETFVGSTTAVSSVTRTAYDYLSVTSITVSSVVEATINVGTNTWGSTPWFAVDTTRDPINLGANLTLNTSANFTGANWEYSLDNPFGTYPNPKLLPPTAWVSSAINQASSSPQIGALTAIPLAAWRLTYVSSVTTSSATLSVIQSG